MNVDKYCEENPQRFSMIGDACKALAIAGETIDKATLSAALPADFALDDSDPWRKVAAEAQKSAAADGSMVATPDVVTPAPAPDPTSHESLAARLLTLQCRAAELRGELHTLTNARANARSVFADCLQEYLSGLPKVTPQQLARDYCAASVRDRAENHAPQRPTFGPSTLDRQLGYQQGGSADDFCRKQIRIGHRRQALPGSMKSAKLPSQS